MGHPLTSLRLGCRTRCNWHFRWIDYCWRKPKKSAKSPAADSLGIEWHIYSRHGVLHCIIQTWAKQNGILLYNSNFSCIPYAGNRTSLRFRSATDLPTGPSLFLASKTSSFSSVMMLLPIWLIKASIGTSTGGSDMPRSARFSYLDPSAIDLDRETVKRTCPVTGRGITLTPALQAGQ